VEAPEVKPDPNLAALDRACTARDLAAARAIMRRVLCMAHPNTEPTPEVVDHVLILYAANYHCWILATDAEGAARA